MDQLGQAKCCYLIAELNIGNFQEDFLQQDPAHLFKGKQRFFGLELKHVQQRSFG